MCKLNAPVMLSVPVGKMLEEAKPAEKPKRLPVKPDTKREIDLE